MTFFEKNTYSEEDIHRLIADGIEESLQLEYKEAGALSKDDKKRAEITKDISAFADSNGGIIIYGVSEQDHKPKEITQIDGRVYTKEWLENCIQLIQPRIDNIQIIPIRFGDISKSVYIVKIPRSSTAPHMAKDYRYYKRYNFMSVPMEDYEIKDIYNRTSIPNLRIDTCDFHKKEETITHIIYNLRAGIINKGHNVCQTYKLSFYINNAASKHVDIIYPTINGNYTIINENRLKFSITPREPIFSNETLDIGDIKIIVSKHISAIFLQHLIIDMILFYNGGEDRVAYIPSQQRFIDNSVEIEKFIHKHKIIYPN